MAIENWKFDTGHSTVGFWVRHLMVSKVHGRFTQWSGSLAFDEANPAASHVEVSIDASSIDTQQAQRDGHLKSPDFFDVAKYPTVTFKSTKVEAVSKEELHVTGDLTLHGETHPVVLKVEFMGQAKDLQGNPRLGFSAHTSISRKEFGLTWNMALEAGGFAVSDKVELVLDVQAIKA